MLTRPTQRLRPAPAASQRPIAVLRYDFPSAELAVTRHQPEVYVLHPSALPLGCGPRMGRAPLGFCLMLRTPPGTPATHVRPRPGREHGPGTAPSILLEPPINAFTQYACDLASQTRPVFPSPAPPGWNRRRFGAHPELRTPPLPATHVRGGDRPSSTDLEQRFTTSAEPPILRVHSMRATSRRTAICETGRMGRS